jgi:hypothetical protein
VQKAFSIAFFFPPLSSGSIIWIYVVTAPSHVRVRPGRHLRVFRIAASEENIDRGQQQIRMHSFTSACVRIGKNRQSRVV